jgi:hypothetical protein
MPRNSRSPGHYFPDMLYTDDDLLASLSRVPEWLLEEVG